METRTWELPKEHWGVLLAQIQKHSKGRPVRVEVIQPSTGDQIVAHHASLLDITLEESGSMHDTIELELGANGELNHRVLAPQRLYAQRTLSGDLVCLDIEHSEGRTLVHFERPLMLAAEADADEQPGA